MTIEIIETDQASIFCQHCNRTIIRGNRLKIGVPHCYHLKHKDQTLMISTDAERLTSIKKNFESDGHKYKVVKCTEMNKQ